MPPHGAVAVKPDIDRPCTFDGNPLAALPAFPWLVACVQTAPPLKASTSAGSRAETVMFCSAIRANDVP
jgi:hypothetical protein